MQNGRFTALSLIFLFFIAALSPLAAALVDVEKGDDVSIIAPIEESKLPLDDVEFIGLKSLEILMPKTSSTSGRAACPTPSSLQTDGGSNGDAGADSNTSRSLGTNPNSGTTGVNGCVDATDTDDWYTITTTTGKDVDVELVVPAGADFDLYLVDSTGNEYDYDWSEYSDPLEKVSTTGTSFSGVASTFYINVRAYSGDGQYTLRTWTNNTPPRPDLIISSITEPASGQPGATVNVEYVVENIYNTTSDPFEVQFILSTDRTFDQFDELISVSHNEGALAENTSRTTNASVTLPNSLANGTYYWIVWADGYNNITEFNDTNNNLASDGVMLVGESCDDMHPNGKDDAGLGSNAPADEANVTAPLGTNVTASYTGCIDGIEENDVFAFDVPENHTIEISITLESTVLVYLYLVDSGLNSVDSDVVYFGGSGGVSTVGSSYDGIGDSYYVNLSRSGTGVNWTMDVWTNYSTPKANLVIDNATSFTTSSSGSNVAVDFEASNLGRLAASSALVSVLLSVDSGLADHDIEIGNTTIPALDINESGMYQLTVVIPTSTPGGNYTLIVVADYDEQIDELNEEDNSFAIEDEILIDTKATSCPAQNDAIEAGITSGDAGGDAASAFNLGTDISMTITGCVHEDVDDEDWYEIDISPGLNLTVTLINSADQDADLYLRDDQGEWFDRPWTGGSTDEVVTTSDSTSFAGSGGTFYISVTGFDSLGVYTLVIETEGVDPNSFNCGQQNDIGLGQDASSGTGSNIGQNPTVDGTGCFSGLDVSDVYAFTINDGKNFQIDFNADSALAFTATLEDANGNSIASVDNTTFGLLFNSYNTDMEGVTKDYILTVQSGGDAGNYNLTITLLDSAPADIAVSSLVCPTNHTSGSENQITWELVSLRGEAFSTSIILHLDLIDSSGAQVARMATKTVVVNGVYNTTFGSGSEYYATVDEQASGYYNCRLTIDVEDSLTESNESNNEQIGIPFYIQNEEELWANDEDRDGYNTTDTGDNMVDDCPTTYGNSTVDRIGCADLDGDGVSNLNDLWPFDKSQALDTDGDSYGDNPDGIDGDACPDVAGIAGGDGGNGCPPADDDGDGVSNALDECPNTVAGTVVGPDGCENDSPIDEPTNPIDPNNPDQNQTDTNQTVVDDDSTQNSGDDGSTDTDTTQSESGVLGMSFLTIGLIGAAIVLLALTFVVARGRGTSKEEKLFDQQQMAYASVGAAPQPVDATITPEQLAYEQQLIAAGYPADYARTYADQHFRPWLNQ